MVEDQEVLVDLEVVQVEDLGKRQADSRFNLDKITTALLHVAMIS